MKIGADSYGEVTLESLELVGTIKLNGTTVAKHLKVTGNLIATSAHLHDVDVDGNVKLTDTTLDQKLRVTGSLQAVGSEFRQPLFFNGQKARFSDCTLSGITIQRDAAFKAKQVIELKGKTFIDGPVNFEGGNGEVLLYPGSKVRGSVSGGKLVHKN